MQSRPFFSALFAGLLGLNSVSAMAEAYTRVPGPIDVKKPANSTRGLIDYSTFLQTCTTDISVKTCVNNGSLGGVYTSESAYTALSSLGCTYMYARLALLNKPGLDVYNCRTGSLVGTTVFVFLDGDFSTSPAWTISLMY